MSILASIVVATLAIGGYKYFKEEDFKQKVDENVKKGFETVKDTVSKLSDTTKEKIDEIKEKKEKKSKKKSEETSE